MNKYRVQLLAEQVLGLTPKQADAIIDGGEDYDTPLKENLGIDFETFGRIAHKLTPFSSIIKKPEIEQIVYAINQFKNEKATTSAQESK